MGQIPFHIQNNIEFRTMTKFLISFPASAMDVPEDEMAAVGEAARAVIREAKAAGIYVFGGGINSEAASLMVSADGNCTNDTYRQTRELDGGFCVLELPSRAVAVHWAAKIAGACRCAQELREFYYDPES
jgi:hypothetical protein